MPPVFMQRPHWLDEVFDSGKGDEQATAEALLSHPRFKGAIDSAAFNYREAAKLAERNQAEGNPPLMGGTPSQAARSAFLESAAMDVTFPGSADDMPPGA